MFELTKWPNELVERLTALVAEGLSASQIGVRIGKSRNAVIGKILRLKIAHLRPKTYDQPRAPRAPRKRTRTVRRRYDIASNSFVDMPIPSALERRAASVEPATPVSFVELKPRHCRYPLWSEKESEGFYCGGVAQFGSPYCVGHSALCFTPRGLREIKAYRTWHPRAR